MSLCLMDEPLRAAFGYNVAALGTFPDRPAGG
jgi:hypothetical protein